LEPLVIAVLIDADACPVKDEIYAVASRYNLPIAVVANSPMRVPEELGAEMIVVEGNFDAADDWIVENLCRSDVVITADIPLAARCIEAGAHVLGTSGRPFTEESIGSALASREIAAHLRETGASTGGPAPISARDRSRFAAKLDELVQRGMREVAAEKAARS